MNFFAEQEELRVYDKTFGLSEGNSLGKLNTGSLAMELCTPRMNAQIYVQIFLFKMCQGG